MTRSARGVGKVTSLVEREGARFRLNIGETSVTSRRSFREDFVRTRSVLDYLDCVALVYNQFLG